MSFLINPYMFGYVAPTTDVLIAVQDFASGSATGDQDVTAARISGVTPKSVISIGTNQDAATSTETAEAIFALGWGDDTRGPNSMCSRSRDNQASTSCVTHSNYAGSSLRGFLSSSTTSLVESANSSMISGGNRFNYSANDATDRRGVCLFVAGADATTYHDDKGLGTGTSPLDEVGPNFQPDVVLFFSSGRGTGIGTNTAFWFSFGICVRDNHSGGGVVQRALLVGENTTQAAGNVFMTIDTGCVGGQMGLGGGADYKYSCDSFDSQGFSITPSASAGSDVAAFHALKLTSRRIKLVDFTTPTSTGSWSITGVGFLPQAAIAVLTNLEDVDSYPGATSDNQSGFSINFIGTDEQWANCVRLDSGADPTDTASNTQNVALLGPSATACDAIKASLTSFDNDGLTLNYSAVQGTGKKGFMLLIE